MSCKEPTRAQQRPQLEPSCCQTACRFSLMEMSEGAGRQELTHFRQAPNNLNTVFDWLSSEDAQIGVKKVSECDNERVGHFFLFLSLC